MSLTSEGIVRFGNIVWNRAAVFEATEALTSTLTPETPPEYVREGTVGPAHMVFSIGAVLCRILTGRLPVPDEVAVREALEHDWNAHDLTAPPVSPRTK